MSHKRDWEELALVDPLWAILSDPAKSKAVAGNGWKLDEFWREGENEANAVMNRAAELGRPHERRTMLDFGCGVGRVTRGFASHFQTCVGLDISEGMIAQARSLNADVHNCSFEVNRRDDLATFHDEQFDLVYCNLVLQHLPRRDAIECYIREFVRVAQPDGLIVFQLPTRISLRHRLQPRRRLYAALRALRIDPSVLYFTLGLNPIRMMAIPEAQVVQQLRTFGAAVLDIKRIEVAGYSSATYFLTK